MADIDVEELKDAVILIVNEAHEDGSIDELTPRMIRIKAAEKLGLETGSLDSLKDVIKTTAGEALDAIEAAATEPVPAPSSEPEDEVKAVKSKGRKSAKPQASTSGSTSKTAKSDTASGSASAKRKSKPSTEDKEADSPPSKKAKVSSKKTGAKKATEEKPESSASKKKNGKGKVVRSASVIPSSDEDEPSKPTPTASPKSPHNKAKPKRPSLPKNTSAHDADVSTAEVGEPREDAVKPKSKLSESVVAAEVHKGEKDEEDITGEGKQDGGKDASDSEMSVLIDEEPAKKRKGRKSKDSSADGKVTKRSTTTTKPKAKGKSKAKASEADEDPEDAEIKRLKSFVSACGVRKLWSREFLAASISPTDKRAQIRHLKELLKELGMEGRLSMEKAKKVREKRELQKELEDVQTFEKAVVHGTSSRSQKSKNDKGATTSGGNESDVEDEDEVLGSEVIKRKPNARQSIMAFLGDQSDSD